MRRRVSARQSVRQEQLLACRVLGSMNLFGEAAGQPACTRHRTVVWYHRPYALRIGHTVAEMDANTSMYTNSNNTISYHCTAAIFWMPVFFILRLRHVLSKQIGPQPRFR
jgi:hypothetical protein